MQIEIECVQKRAQFQDYKYYIIEKRLNTKKFLFKSVMGNLRHSGHIRPATLSKSPSKFQEENNAPIIEIK